jgi:hypothetical protein
MELLLFAVTAVSLALALVMSIAVLRVQRAERVRAEARVAALSAAASEPETPPVKHVKEIQAPVKPVESPAAAAPPVVVEAPRSAAPWAAARVSSFSNAARSAGAPARAIVADELPLQSAAPAVLGEGFLGGGASVSDSAGRQRGLAVAALVLFAVAVGGGYWMIFGGRSATAAAAVTATADSPLELVSLRHERRGAALNVTGLVRNPVGGVAIDKLSAVVFLFDQQGGFLSSARANVDYLKLAPGDESPFVISLDAPANVARYRVSFRTDAGIVPHVDRRGQDPVAATALNQRAPAR